MPEAPSLVIYQLKASLRGISPMIWRRLLVPDDLTLLANVIMAWNTYRIQTMIDQAADEHPDDVLSRLAPIGHKHINMRGTLRFELAQHAASLLRPGHIVNNERMSK